MTPDRDELFLQKTLQEGLHPADRDLWPAVAEALPGAARRQRRRTRALRVAVCLCVPVLVAAGALLGRAEFTNLREDPRPSFAPENNTGYAIRYDLTAYALPEELNRSLLEAADGEANGGFSWYISTIGSQTPPLQSPGTHGYDSWLEMTADTGLPLVQSELLDSSQPEDAIILYPAEEEIPLPDNWKDLSLEERNAYYEAYYDDLWRLAGDWPAGFTVEWLEDTPLYLYPRRVDRLADGCSIELQAYVSLAGTNRPAGTTFQDSQVYFDKKANLIWENEEYTTPSGLTAVLPRCTSNGKQSPWLNSYAFFELDGIFYRVCITTYDTYDGWGWVEDSGEAARAVLKQVLDSFTPAPAGAE